MNSEIENIFNLYRGLKDDLIMIVPEVFQLDAIYYEYEENYGFKYVDDLMVQLTNASIDVVQNNFFAFENAKNYIKQVTKTNDITDDELLILLVTIIANYFKRKVDNSNALFQGDEWKNNEDMINFYSNATRAENHGYNNYINDNVGVEYTILNNVVNGYTNMKNNYMK